MKEINMKMKLRAMMDELENQEQKRKEAIGDGREQLEEKVLMQQDMASALEKGRPLNDSSEGPKKKVRFSEIVIVYGNGNEKSEEPIKQKETLRKLVPPQKRASRSMPKILPQKPASLNP